MTPGAGPDADGAVLRGVAQRIQTALHLRRLRAITGLQALARDEARRREAGIDEAESHAYAIRRSQLVERGPGR